MEDPRARVLGNRRLSTGGVSKGEFGWGVVKIPAQEYPQEAAPSDEPLAMPLETMALGPLPLTRRQNGNKPSGAAGQAVERRRPDVNVRFAEVELRRWGRPGKFGND